MKRRTGECGKLRRPLKRNKIAEGIYGSSTLLYLKFFTLWALVILADFILEFRFEFLWPFWLLLRSVYDSFKYQGLAFSVFFVCIALTSDMICFFFIPMHWLFFAASTYVWVQYVWHTEKGVCLPTVVLWLLFVYIEAAVRLRDSRHVPFHLDLCRPFAAHCIGYPVVTLGFGFKSYVGFRLRQRRQRDVAKENEFYAQLLLHALPADPTPVTPAATTQPISQPTAQPIADKHKGGGGVTTELPSVSANGHAPSKNSHRKTQDKGDVDKRYATAANGSAHHPADGSSTQQHTEFIERVTSVNDFDEEEAERGTERKGCGVRKWAACAQARDNAVNSQRERKNRANRDQDSTAATQAAAAAAASHSHDHVLRLEADVKRLKVDLQSSRQTEQDLRQQVSTLVCGEKSVKCELSQFQQDNDHLQSKLHGLVTARQLDKQALAQLERRLADERRVRGLVEAQLAAERKAKKNEEAAAARAIAVAAANKQPECCEATCRQRRRELEAELKTARRELKVREERTLAAEREAVSLRQYKESHSETEILMSALSAMQDKNAHLENSLSAETRIKLDLFSALGEAKRQLQIRDNMVRSKDKEVCELKSKIAQVLAVMPTDTFCAPPVSPHGTSKLRLADCGMPLAMRLSEQCPGCTVSNLDPNATAYTPKSSHPTD